MVGAVVATVIELPRIIVRRTVSSSAAIPKGSLLQLSSSPNTVTVSSSDNQKFAGIAVEEKVSSETDILTIGVAIDGVWEISTSSSSITAGVMVNLSGTNEIDAAVDGDFEVGSLVGRAESTKDSEERIRVRLLGF